MSDTAALVLPETLNALKPACQRCRWMFRDGDMVCRRMPPQATIMLAPIPPPSMRAGQLAPMTFAAFPTVQKDMFCGEFRLAAGKMD